MKNIPDKIWKLYEGHPERWCQGRDFVGPDGKWCFKEQAVKACLRGASELVYGSRWPIYASGLSSVTAFNDNSTFEEVLEFVKIHDL